MLSQIDTLNVDSLTRQNSQLSDLVIPILVVLFILFALVLLFRSSGKNKKLNREFYQPDLPPTQEFRGIIKRTDTPTTATTLKNKFTPPEPPSISVSKPIGKAKKIGYQPVKIFDQHTPFHFPIVIMSNNDSWVKFPQRSLRSRNIGITEKKFKENYLLRYFSSQFIFDDRVLKITDGRDIYYEPDFTYQNENKNLNLFIDIEIDEPYDGAGNSTHYVGSDDQRNYDFKKRGWIIIRFAESQIVRQPDSCCKVIAEVINSVAPSLNIIKQFEKVEDIESVRQWSKDEAVLLMDLKFREQYLNRDSIGIIDLLSEQNVIDETPDGKIVEDELKKIPEEQIKRNYVQSPIINHEAYNKISLLNTIVSNRSAIKFRYMDGDVTMVKDARILKENNKNLLVGFCMLKNEEKIFELSKIINIEEVKKPIHTSLTKRTDPTDRYSKMTNFDSFKSVINDAVRNKQTIVLHYTKRNGEKSIRAVSNLSLPSEHLIYESMGTTRENFLGQFPSPVKPERYIIGYCHLREYVGRTFRIDSMDKLFVLNL